MNITKSREFLKALPAFRMYKQYIHYTLAGDFACDLVKELEAQQAKIDALMLEYCPSEMTQEQVEAFEKAQVKVK